MKIDAVVSNSIYLNPNQLSSGLLQEILDRLTISNPAKKIAVKEMLWNANCIPSHLKLYTLDENDLVLPRGFIFEFEKLLANWYIDIIWDDQTSYDEINSYHTADPTILLRDYQDLAVQELFTAKNGIYKASTGSGKSITMLELIRCCDQKTIVFCEKSDIAVQWIEFAGDIGFKSVGFIGDGTWNDKEDLTIALRQSVWNKPKQGKIAQEWFDSFGMVVWDETHHISASTPFELIQRFPAYYRYGCSATPDSDPDLFPVISAVIGPVVHESSLKEIGEHLVIPSVRVISTEFEYPYRPTFRRGHKVIRNNYSRMIQALESDVHRNSLIVENVLKEFRDGHACLVLSSHKKHLDFLYHMFHEALLKEEMDRIFLLTGDNSKEFREIADEIDRIEDGSILLSTLATEGTDVAKLDRLFLTYPGRKLRGYEQAIGRIMRIHPKKTDAIVYDFRDAKMSLLNNQFRDRMQQIFNKRGYNVS